MSHMTNAVRKAIHRPNLLPAHPFVEDRRLKEEPGARLVC